LWESVRQTKAESGYCPVGEQGITPYSEADHCLAAFHPAAENSVGERSGHHRSGCRRPQHLACRSAGGNSACRLQTVRARTLATSRASLHIPKPTTA